jgi:hypothetical protein
MPALRRKRSGGGGIEMIGLPGESADAGAGDGKSLKKTGDLYETLMVGTVYARKCEKNRAFEQFLTFA